MLTFQASPHPSLNQITMCACFISETGQKFVYDAKLWQYAGCVALRNIEFQWALHLDAEGILPVEVILHMKTSVHLVYM